MNNVASAIRANVVEALTAWRDDCISGTGNHAILYAAGHGVVNSKDEPLVLLEDFASEPLVLHGAMNIGNVSRGMQGVGQAPVQVYFVDACEEVPKSLQMAAELGNGYVLDEKWPKERRTAAPIYSSAISGTVAYGRFGRGTLFCEALLGCLNGRAAENRDGRWRVTTSRLFEVLNKDVALLAKKAGHKQTAVQRGGLVGKPATIQSLEGPPSVPWRCRLTPAAVAATATGSLFGDRGQTVQPSIVFKPNPLSMDIAAGIYTLKVVPGVEQQRYRPECLKPFVADVPQGAIVSVDVRREAV